MNDDKSNLKIGVPKGFLKGVPWIADEADCQTSWSGGKNGKYFRCYLCGHKFIPGDRVRVVYSNNTPAHGNPKVCENCDAGDEEVLAEWQRMHNEAKTKYWWFSGEIFGQ